VDSTELDAFLNGVAVGAAKHLPGQLIEHAVDAQNGRIDGAV
jgi:hypothetical protein